LTWVVTHFLPVADLTLQQDLASEISLMHFSVVGDSADLVPVNVAAKMP
jgi:hypothetical protein